MLAALFLPESRASLQTFARAHGLRCKCLVIDSRVTATALVGTVRVDDVRVQVNALVVLPVHKESGLGLVAVSPQMEVAFQPCVTSY